MRSVRRQIIKAFAVVIISSVVVEAAIIIANEAVFSRYRLMTDNLLQEYQLVERSSRFVTDYFAYTKAIGDVGRRENYQQQRQGYLDTLEYLDRRIVGKDNRVALMAVRNTVNSMLAEAQAAVDEAERGELSRMTERYNEVSRLATFVGETGTSLVIKDLAESSKLDAEAERLRQSLNWVVLAMTLLIMLGSIAFAVSFAKGFTAPLLDLVSFADKVSAGDLMAEPPRSTAGSGETGVLTSAFTKTVASLRSKLQDLEKAAARTKSIVEGAPFGAHTFRLEADGRLVFVATNRSAEKIIGAEHAKLIGKTLEEAFPGNVGTEIPEAYRRVAVTGVPYEKTQYFYESQKISGVFEISAVQTAPQEVTVFFRDISDRARAEDNLRQSEEDLKLAQAVAHIGSWRVNLETGMMTWSEEARRIFGVDTSRDEISAEELAEMRVHPEDRSLSREFIAAVKRGERVDPAEVKVVRPDGTTRIVRVEVGEFIKAEDGATSKVTGICQDVTERRHAELALEENERRYRAFVEQTSDVIFAVDITGHITYISPKIARFGLSTEETVGHSIYDFILEEDQGRVREEFERGLTNPTDEPPVSFRLRNGHGDMFWVEETDSLQYDANGQPVGIVGILRDVTERQRTQERLAESERRLRAFVENSYDVIFAADLTGKVTYVSPQIKQFGFDDSAVIGHPFVEAIHSDDREMVMKEFASFVAGVSRNRTLDLRLLAPDGKVTVVEETGQVQMEGSKPVGIIGVLRDVTERRAAEAATRDSLELERLFSRRSAALVDVRPNELSAKVTEILKELGTHFGADRSSVFAISEDRKKASRRYAWFKNGKPDNDPGLDMTVEDYPWIFSVLSGNEIVSFNGKSSVPPQGVAEMERLGFVEESTTVFVPLKVEGEAFGGFVLTDLGGRHRWREEEHVPLRLVSELIGKALGRQLNDRRLREADLIISSGNMVAFTWRNAEGWPVEYVSRNVAGLTGYADTDFLTGERSFQDLIHQDDLRRVGTEIVKNSEMPTVADFQHEPYRLVAKDGTIKWLGVRTFIERDESGKPVYYRGLIEDITARRAAELKVNEVNRLRQRFIHVVAHQLRTPLNSIRWSLEAMLSGELGEMKKEQRDFVRVVYDAEIEIISRIHDMLTALDIEEGRVNVVKETVAIQPVISSLLSELKITAARRNITIETDLGGSSDLSLQADAEKLRFSMHVILHNAIVYSRDGGKVVVRETTDNGRFRLTVIDEGIGIPAVEQSSIYNRFFRASNASVVNQNASGLGLSIAKYYVERHGGTMGFESVEDKGSTFYLEVPLA
jgi:PAS domain S-box-containing protein